MKTKIAVVFLSVFACASLEASVEPLAFLFLKCDVLEDEEHKGFKGGAQIFLHEVYGEDERKEDGVTPAEATLVYNHMSVLRADVVRAAGKIVSIEGWSHGHAMKNALDMRNFQPGGFDSSLKIWFGKNLVEEVQLFCKSAE